MSVNWDGGYDRGYKCVSCFWGKEPASLVREFLSAHPVQGMRVLDIGAGEGKNAYALAAAGAAVDAVECSAAAIANGRQAFSSDAVNWICGDVAKIEMRDDWYDLIVSYGLVHCMADQSAALALMRDTQKALKPGGAYLLAAFNDGPHDLSAHEGFSPLLLPHSWYTRAFQGWKLLTCTDSLLYETHPHNNIPHHHSMSRIWATKPI